MVEFMQQGTTIMSEVYCETLKILHNAIHNNRYGMLTSNIVLLHDNVRPHTAACPRALLEYLNWELFGHPLYSLILALSDYMCFSNNAKLMEGVKM
jgi:hypothetical protein